MIGIIGALKAEIEQLLEAMRDYDEETVSGIHYYKGALFGTDIVVALSGVGKVHAAVCAQTMILKYAPQIIVNTGVAGGLAAGLAVGDIVIASSLIQHDIDNSGVGDPVGLIPGIGLVHIPCAEYLVSRFRALAGSTPDGSCYTGPVATGDQFVSDRDKALWLHEKFKALACEQEGGSIAQVCYINAVDFCAIRAISDNADGASSVDYFNAVQPAAKRSAGLVMDYIKLYADR